MLTFFWTLVGFLSGSIPFAFLIGKLLAKTDIRTFGDGNPGGTNAFKAGGPKAGLPALLLDLLKGFLPVYLAQKYGLGGWNLVPVCLAPVLGHAFSPFLRFQGGKALAATAGVWVGLLGWWAFPIYGILAVPLNLIQTEDAWAASAGMLALLVYSILFGQPWLVAVAALNAALIAWTHHHALACGPHLRPWVANFIQRRHA